MSPISTSQPSSQQVGQSSGALALGVMCALLVFDTVALLFAGVVHLVGAQIPLGSVSFDEPPLIAAGVVETLAGLMFIPAVYAALARTRGAWGWALGAHLFAIAGFLLGVWATRNGTTTFNHDYHLVMLAIFVCGLILLMTPWMRASLRRRAG